MKKLILILLLTTSFSISALTVEQKSTLKATINTEPSIAQCLISGDHVCLSDWLNLNSTFVVWRTSVPQAEYQTREDLGTSFSWSGTGGFIARTQGERDAWRTIFAAGSVDPSKTNIIAAFNDIFSGSGAGAVATRLHLLTLSKRIATNAEKALSTGVGTDITPGRMSFQGKITVNDIPEILSAP